MENVSLSLGEIPIVVDFSQLTLGNHSLLITATSTDGEVATHDLPFTVPEPLGPSGILTVVL